MQAPTHSVGFPVAGEWVAINTPAERIPSHGTDFFGQRFAYDFARLNRAGAGFSRRSTLRQFAFYVDATDFLAWHEPVFAAFSGTVLSSEDGWSDRLRINAVWQVLRASLLQRSPPRSDLRPLLGNYILIEGKPGVALYAHLSKGSISVQRGQAVRAGQCIASVGNSGNSTMPHLHFHVMDRSDPWKAEGVYCGFNEYDSTVNSFVPSLMTPFHARPLPSGDA